MIEFDCLVKTTKYIVQKKKLRVFFELNEGSEKLVPTCAIWCEKETWLKINVDGNKGTHEEMIGQMWSFKPTLDRGIDFIYEIIGGERYVAQLLTASLAGEWLHVKVEQTEAPYGLETRTKRKTDWNKRD